MMSENSGLNRSHRRVSQRWLLLLVILALFAGSCAGEADTTTTAATGEEEASTTTAAAPEETTAEGAEVTAPEIPASTVRFALYPCCADQTPYQIAIEKGWYDELGITLDPEGAHQYTLFDQILPSMQRGDFDTAGIFVQGYLQTLDTFGQDIPPIWFNDIYVGYAILKAPGSDATTTQDFIDQGMEPGEAMAAAVAQLEGAEVYTPPHGQVQPPYPDVFMSYAGLSYPDDLNLQFLEDQNIIAVATQEGRIEFAIPYAAPVVVQMLREGWEPVINTVQVLNDVGSEQAARMTTLVGSSGLFAQRDWVDANRDTVLRFLSVGYRTLDYLNDPETQMDGWTIQANLINATQGLSLIPEDIGVIWDEIDPMFTWEDQGPQLWDDPEAPFHVRTSLETQIQSLIDNGTLAGPLDAYDLDQFLVAEQLYREMVDLQTQADDLFAEAESMELSASQQEVVDQAQTHYDAYNFLDAVNFLEAAIGG
jgi:ABC-type nitrate/sulfonate/bicarbonate transport system substrate-binding protein